MVVLVFFALLGVFLARSWNWDRLYAIRFVKTKTDQDTDTTREDTFAFRVRKPEEEPLLTVAEALEA